MHYVVEAGDSFPSIPEIWLDKIEIVSNPTKPYEKVLPSKVRGAGFIIENHSEYSYSFPVNVTFSNQYSSPQVPRDVAPARKPQ
jgi:hypothetical protein